MINPISQKLRDQLAAYLAERARKRKAREARAAKKKKLKETP